LTYVSEVRTASILRAIIALMMEAVRRLEAGKKFIMEELHRLYSSPYIIIMIKSRMTWAGHVM
jgi:hypothetical protein